jgi:hypothetical protein
MTIEKSLSEWELYADWSENAREDWEDLLDDWGDEWQIEFFKDEVVEAYSDQYDYAENATEALCAGVSNICSNDRDFLNICFRGVNSVINNRNYRLAVLGKLLEGVLSLNLATEYGSRGSDNWPITCASDAIDTINEVLSAVSKYYGIPTEFDLDSDNTWSYEIANYESSTGYAKRYC